MAIGPDGMPLVVWDEVVEATRRIAMARVRSDASGRASFSPVRAPDGAAGQWYPVVASTTSGVVAAWVRQTATASTIGVARVR
ncbi:MAG: hypothetical protein V4550_19995 [Gemmatimonadota bacterium]